MSIDTISPDPSFRPDQPANWDNQLETMAAELYRIGSMLLGEGEETIGLVERAVTTADISSRDETEARKSGVMTLAAGAIEALVSHDAQALVAPEGDSGPASCIDDDDLSAAGVTHAELELMLSGPDRGRLRGWLEGLSAPLRVIFVLHAVAGLSSVDVAVLLADHGGSAAETWTPDAVRGSFRQALCSLASQLLHSSVTH